MSTRKLSSSPSKRRDNDLVRLMMSDHEVTVPDEDKLYDFHVTFHGPPQTPYEGGIWDVHVTLPQEYPYKSPSIGFSNRLYHPNVDDVSGSVCLDVINQTWSPMFDLVNIFEVFLPQLLMDPNPTDPLNGEAAALLMRDPEAYNAKVREFVLKYATVDKAKSSERKSNEDDDIDTPESFSRKSSDRDGIFEMEDVPENVEDDESELSELSDIDT
mmetsp:Transcript_14840/g.19576  ORF Transcript_14840/g.19576 Transcript_14840/m.19576 type:complete len:214 (-) Transcript_14840:460-1101(-)